MKKNTSLALNKYLADSAVFYIKLHNLHWNVVGLAFKEVHEYLETLYNEFALILDSVAEIIKMNSHQPLASLSEYLKVSTIKELGSKDIAITEALKIVFEDVKSIKENVVEIRCLALKEDLFDVTSLLEGHLNSFNKTLWFLESMIKNEKK